MCIRDRYDTTSRYDMLSLIVKEIQSTDKYRPLASVSQSPINISLFVSSLVFLPPYYWTGVSRDFPAIINKKNYKFQLTNKNTLSSQSNKRTATICNKNIKSTPIKSNINFIYLRNTIPTNKCSKCLPISVSISFVH